MRGRLIVVALLASGSACTLLTSLDDLSQGGASDGGTDADGATLDTGSDVAPLDAGTDAFSPSDVGGLELWLASDVGTAVEEAGTGTWSDQAKQHTVVADGNVCHVPTLTPAAIHGLPAFSFNPYAMDCFSISSGFDDFSGGLAIMVVAQPQACNSSFIGSGAALLDLSTDVGVNDISFGRNPNPANTSSGDFQLYVQNGSGGTGWSVGGDAGTTWINGVTHLYEVQVPAGPPGNTTTGFLYLDGVAVPTPTLSIETPVVAARGTNFIGRAPNAPTTYIDLCGLVAEVVVYRKVMSDKDRKALEAYLMNKWGL